MAGWKGRATDHISHVLSDDLLIPDAVLHRTDGAVRVENVGRLRNGTSGVNGLRGNNAIIAARHLIRVAGGVEAGREVSRSGKL